MKPVRKTLVHDRRSACPGLFRMAQALDGGICRVKLTFGNLTSDQAKGIARAAEEFGNGIIDITNRANVQIRGVRPDSEDALVDSLLALGLGPLTDKGDDIRNVMISPLVGQDDKKSDIRPLATRILTELQTNPRYQTLSPKFCILIDGGEDVAMVTHPHDLWLSPINPENPASAYAFGVAGTPPVLAGDQSALGLVSTEKSFELVTAILDLFIEWNIANPDASRLRHMLADLGRDHFIGRVEGRLDKSLRNADLGQWRRTPPQANGHLGIVKTSNASFQMVGAMPPLGRLNPDMLRNLAAIADRYCSGALQLTPWQSVLLSGVAKDHAEDALDSTACTWAYQWSSGAHCNDDQLLRIGWLQIRAGGDAIGWHPPRRPACRQIRDAANTPYRMQQVLRLTYGKTRNARSNLMRVATISFCKRPMDRRDLASYWLATALSRNRPN